MHPVCGALEPHAHPTKFCGSSSSSSSKSACSSASSSPARGATSHYHSWTTEEVSQFVAAVNTIAAKGERFAKAHPIVRQLAARLFDGRYEPDTAIQIVHNKWTNASKSIDKQFQESSDEELTKLVCEARKKCWDVDGDETEDDEPSPSPSSNNRFRLPPAKQPASMMWAWIGNQMHPPRIGKLCERHWASIQDKRTSIALQRSAERARSFESALSPSPSPPPPPNPTRRFFSVDDGDMDMMADVVSSLAHLADTPLVPPVPLPRQPISRQPSTAIAHLEAEMNALANNLLKDKNNGNDMYFMCWYTGSAVDYALEMLKQTFPVFNSSQDRTLVQTVMSNFQQRCQSLFESFMWRYNIDAPFAQDIAPLYKDLCIKWATLFEHLKAIPLAQQQKPQPTSL